MLRVFEIQAQIQFYKLASYPLWQAKLNHQTCSPTSQKFQNIDVQIFRSTLKNKDSFHFGFNHIIAPARILGTSREQPWSSLHLKNFSSKFRHDQTSKGQNTKQGEKYGGRFWWTDNATARRKAEIRSLPLLLECTGSSSTACLLAILPICSISFQTLHSVTDTWLFPF